MLSVGELHRLALTLPQSSVRDHHGRDSFRVAGKIFATVPDEGHVRIMLDEPGILAAVAAHPGVCEPTYWASGWPACPSTWPPLTPGCSWTCLPMPGSGKAVARQGPA